MSTAVLFQTMPPLSVEEYANLEQSIREHGIQVPIIVDEDGVVIDGHHRQRIANTIGIPCPVEMKFGLTEIEKRTLSVSLNIDRRQLSREQRRAIIAESIKADPDLSNREHARRVGVDDKTVGTVRRELESTAEIPQSDTRVSADGRERPATQPQRPVAVEYADPTTGEVIDLPVKTTERQTFTTITEPAPIREPKPVLRGEAAAKDSAEQGSAALGRALVVIDGLKHPKERARRIRDWPLGLEAATPDARDLANPSSFRVMAVALNTFADEWERTNG